MQPFKAMNKIGRNSIISGITIPNATTPNSPFNVRVQANKNYAICDIVLVNRVKENKKFYFVPIRRITEVLSEFQGRQFNSPSTREHLSNVLFELFNNKPAV